MLSLLWRTIEKIAAYVPGAARESQNLRVEVADNPTCGSPDIEACWPHFWTIPMTNSMDTPPIALLLLQRPSAYNSRYRIIDLVRLSHVRRPSRSFFSSTE